MTASTENRNRASTYRFAWLFAVHFLCLLKCKKSEKNKKNENQCANSNTGLASWETADTKLNFKLFREAIRRMAKCFAIALEWNSTSALIFTSQSRAISRPLSWLDESGDSLIADCKTSINLPEREKISSIDTHLLCVALSRNNGRTKVISTQTWNVFWCMKEARSTFLKFLSLQSKPKMRRKKTFLREKSKRVQQRT